MKKIERGGMENTHYKKVESEQSGKLGKKVYKRYQSGFGIKHLFHRHNTKIFELLQTRRNIDLESKSLLEIGCGFGDFLNQAEKRVSYTYGIDMNFDQLCVAKKNLLTSAKVLLADGEFLPFKADCFDFIVLKGVVHHLGNPHSVFREAKKRLERTVFS